MRVLALIGLVLALLVVGVLAKKQLAATNAIVVPAVLPAGGGPQAPGLQGGADGARAQSRQLQQQYQQALDAAMQPRAMPDEAR